MAESKEVPPSFAPTTIDLVSVKDGKVTHVSLYSSRAEITRLFRFEAKVGLNQVNINGLPNTLDPNSLKVEGTGHATIHDVTISDLPLPEKPTTSDKLDDLLHKKKKTDQAIDRCSLAIKSLETYLGTLNVKDVGVAEVANIVKTYQATGEGLDNQITGLWDEQEKLESDIKTERKNLENPAENQELRKRASVGLFADTEGEVGIKLIYAVHQAHWEAFYDIRVNMQKQDKPVELTYKASISQSTGEGWNDVDLTLETANPTFGVNIPRLAPWTISSYRPVLVRSMKSKGLSRASVAMPVTSALLGGDAAAPHGYKYQEPEPEMSQMEARVNSRGNITATFGVPGKISIPSDGATHSVTIIKLNLDAQMRWVVVPKFEAKTHLSAKIKNASEYTLLSGEASIYVDGSFIARTELPLVSPEENFDCPLGLDPSIRITYHPRNKKTTRTGFYNKSITHVYTQRITVVNTKTSAVDDLKVTDQFPVSEDSTITVKRISPALVDVLKETSSGEIKIPDKLKVSSGVFAQWNGADEPDVNVESLGAEGKFDWACTIPSQGKMDLVLQYEITAPSNTQISGL